VSKPLATAGFGFCDGASTHAQRRTALSSWHGAVAHAPGEMSGGEALSLAVFVPFAAADSPRASHRLDPGPSSGDPCVPEADADAERAVVRFSRLTAKNQGTSPRPREKAARRPEAHGERRRRRCQVVPSIVARDEVYKGNGRGLLSVRAASASRLSERRIRKANSQLACMGIGIRQQVWPTIRPGESQPI
jgi:hypothetical protein